MFFNIFYYIFKGKIPPYDPPFPRGGLKGAKPPSRSVFVFHTKYQGLFQDKRKMKKVRGARRNAIYGHTVECFILVF